MAAASPPAQPANPAIRSARGRRSVQPLRPGEGHSFFWRRLHSLTGIVPIGAFLVEHIISNFETWNGPLAYAQQVKFLNSLPLVRVLEWVFIFIPLAYHAGYGVFIWLRGRSNVNVYPWAGNWGYYAQRITGLIALLYIGYHVWSQRFHGVSLPENPQYAFHKVQLELENTWVLAAYIIAMIATCWHFAYGIWLFAAKWGITPGNRARKRFGYICAAGGSALCALGLIAIYSVVWKYPNAPIPYMPQQPAGITEPAPTTALPGTTNPTHPGAVR
jgi:succinate dehydrogenase / fumarate reductase cytochrome b subunit